MAAKQGFLMYYSKGDAIGTKVSVRYRRSGRLSGVVVKRGSTVCELHRGFAFQCHSSHTEIPPTLHNCHPYFWMTEVYYG